MYELTRQHKEIHMEVDFAMFPAPQRSYTHITEAISLKVN